jgi:hypothetical protein
MREIGTYRILKRRQRKRYLWRYLCRWWGIMLRASYSNVMEECGQDSSALM